MKSFIKFCKLIQHKKHYLYLIKINYLKTKKNNLSKNQHVKIINFHSNLNNVNIKQRNIVALSKNIRERLL